MIYILDTSATLNQGDKGAGVKGLQEALNALGHDAGTPDGIFGGGTRKAVAAFQAGAGLDADGVAGKRTFSAIVEALRAQDEAGRAQLAESLAAAQSELLGWLNAGISCANDPAALEQWMAQGNELIGMSFGQIEQAGAALA